MPSPHPNPDDDDDNTLPPIYPAYCNKFSPTYNTWVKLTNHDVHHRLQPRPGTSLPSTTASHHTNQNPLPIYYLNHPIRFIQLTGIIVAIDDYYAQNHLFTLDDSSDTTIDIVFRKPKPTPTPALAYTYNNGTAPQTNTAAEDVPVTADEVHILTLLPTLNIGTTVRAKGTLSIFRNVRQLTLLRLECPLTTSDELRHIAARNAFQLNTLCSPWVVSKKEQERLYLESQGEVRNETERTKRARRRREKIAERERRYMRLVEKEWETEEKNREEQADVARRAGGELKLRRMYRLWRDVSLLSAAWASENVTAIIR